jgi:hypothetical protein
MPLQIFRLCFEPQFFQTQSISVLQYLCLARKYNKFILSRFLKKEDHSNFPNTLEKYSLEDTMVFKIAILIRVKHLKVFFERSIKCWLSMY